MEYFMLKDGYTSLITQYYSVTFLPGTVVSVCYTAHMEIKHYHHFINIHTNNYMRGKILDLS